MSADWGWKEKDCEIVIGPRVIDERCSWMRSDLLECL